MKLKVNNSKFHFASIRAPSGHKNKCFINQRMESLSYKCNSIPENFYEISPRSRRDHGEIWEISRPKTRRDLAAILAEISARYGNLGGQIRGEMLQRDRGEIWKSRRPKRAVIAR